MGIGKLKRFLDSTVGEHGYICIRNKRNDFLCEGIVSDLRNNQLWELLDEENTDIIYACVGESESGRKAIIIKINLPVERKGKRS